MTDLDRLCRISIVRRNWSRIVLDLHGMGMNDESIAKALRIAPSSVRNWKYGAEPVHSTGEALLALHARRMEFARAEKLVLRRAVKAQRERERYAFQRQKLVQEMK